MSFTKGELLDISDNSGSYSFPFFRFLLSSSFPLAHRSPSPSSSSHRKMVASPQSRRNNWNRTFQLPSTSVNSLPTRRRVFPSLSSLSRNPRSHLPTRTPSPSYPSLSPHSLSYLALTRTLLLALCLQPHLLLVLVRVSFRLVLLSLNSSLQSIDLICFELPLIPPPTAFN